MQKSKSFAAKALWALAPVLVTLMVGQAQAVPSYARQTGQDCVACHIGAFGPQLTPFGVKFKLGGYVDSDGKSGKIPLSGMVIADYNRYKEANAEDPEQMDTKSKTGLAEASLFLAGKLTDHLGSFVQVTHNGVAHETSIDQADLRYADTITLSGQEALVGVSVNNNPTVQDPFNTLAVWSFPYTGSDRTTGPGVDTVGAGTEQRVIGVNAYTLLNDSIYAELGLYNTISPSIQSRLGLTAAGGQELGGMGNAPYWRLAYFKDLRTQAWNVGVHGFNGSLKDRATGDLNAKFNDFGVDGSYQFLGNRQHVVTVNGSYLRERVTTLGDEGDVKNTIKDFRLAASYNFMNTYGASLGYFKATNSNQESGNRGFIYQADWTPFGKESSWNAPWANLRVGVQYIAFKHYVEHDEETGESTVLAKPGDKNSLRLFAWTSF
jgi:hypothetical protein